MRRTLIVSVMLASLCVLRPGMAEGREATASAVSAPAPASSDADAWRWTAIISTTLLAVMAAMMAIRATKEACMSGEDRRRGEPTPYEKSHAEVKEAQRRAIEAHDQALEEHNRQLGNLRTIVSQTQQRADQLHNQVQRLETANRKAESERDDAFALLREVDQALATVNFHRDAAQDGANKGRESIRTFLEKRSKPEPANKGPNKGPTPAASDDDE